MTDLRDYDFEAAGDENHLCNICLLMIRNAVEIECAHTFCVLCLKEWQRNENARKGDSFYCPTCRTLYRHDQVHRSKYLDRIIKSRMLVKCKKHKLGCQWVATIDDYYKLHENTCDYRIVNCEKCNEPYTFNKRQEHSRKCYIRCPNAGCNQLMKKEQVPFHFENECLHEVIWCSYSRYGCVIMMKRGMIDEHHQTAWNHHLDLFNHHHDTLTQKNSTLNQENSTLKYENITQKQENSTLKQENSTLKQENSKLKQTIAQPQHKLQQEQQQPQTPQVKPRVKSPLSTTQFLPVSCLSAEDRRKDWTFRELYDLLRNKSTRDKFNAIIASKPSLTKLRGHRNNTLLHCAAMHGAAECVEVLIANDCDVKQKTSVGRMAIHDAALNNSTQVMKILLSHDLSSINATTIHNVTPLCCAALWNHREAVELLLSQPSVDVNVKDRCVQTPDEKTDDDQIKRMIKSHRNNSTSIDD